MTRFRLNAGRSAPRMNGSGSSAPPSETAVKVKRSRIWTPNQEPDTPLKCGCKIPWPIVTLLDHRHQGDGKLVQCDLHGWQTITKKEITRALQASRKEAQCRNQPAFDDIPPY